MKLNEVEIVSDAIDKISEVAEMSREDILEAFSGYIFSEEECGQILDYAKE